MLHFTISSFSDFLVEIIESQTVTNDQTSSAVPLSLTTVPPPPTTATPKASDPAGTSAPAEDEGLSTVYLVFIGLGACVVGVPLLCVMYIGLKAVISSLCQKKPLPEKRRPPKRSPRFPSRNSNQHEQF